MRGVVGDRDDGVVHLDAPAPFRFRYLPGTGPRLVISFSGVGEGRPPEPPIEFRRSASEGGRNHVLFVTDVTRSWLTAPDAVPMLASAIGRIEDGLGTESTAMVGNSMGGYMALRLAAPVGADSVLAIAPQYSPHERFVPGERRWRYYRRRLPVSPADRIERIETGVGLMTILHGDHRMERIHAERFPRARGVRHLILPGGDHHIARELKHAGTLDRIVSLAVARKPVRLVRLLKRHGFVFADRRVHDSPVPRAA